MQNTFFSQLGAALVGTANRMTIDVQGQEQGVRVVITPRIGSIPADAPNEVRKLYAALAAPLVVVGKPEDVEAGLLEKLANFTETVRVGMSAVDEIKALAEAAVKASKEKTSKAKPTAKQAATDVNEPSEEGNDTGDGESQPAAPVAAAAPVGLEDF